MRRLRRSNGLRASAVLGALLVALSCTDLSENPVTEITEENFNPTEEDLAALMGDAYNDLRNWWMGWYGYVDIIGETGDLLVTPVRPNGWDDGGVYRFRHEHSWNSSRGGVSPAWGRSYGMITDINRILHQIDEGLIPIEGDLRTATVAELRALRAYAYSILLDWYGNVPISTDFTSTELPDQSTRQEVYDFVVSELTEAIPDLSPETGQSTYGRINRWAAKGILARVYLNAEVYTGTPRYDEVIEETDDIIESGLYALESDYRAPFARDNHDSVEMIWGLPYDAVNGCCSNFHMKTLKPELRHALNLSAQPWGGSASNPQFIDTYDEDDTRLEDTWLMGDVRDDEGRGYTFVQHVPSMLETEFHHGFPVWKYEVYAGMTGASDVDYPILRYAEVLMMKAEALLRMGDPGGAAGLVTQVRERAFAETDPSKAEVTGAELMEGSAYNYGWYDTDGVVKTGPGGDPVEDGGADIEYGRFLDELAWEFAAEGHRRQQLIRFGVFTTKSWFNHEADVDRVADASHLRLFPIPQGVLDENEKLSQNPGY
ncbi:MAG: RagB/SusD family nutrient uptake outer membrane protein [Gemmatimonadota bacterium]